MMGDGVSTVYGSLLQPDVLLLDATAGWLDGSVTIALAEGWGFTAPCSSVKGDKTENSGRRRAGKHFTCPDPITR